MFWVEPQEGAGSAASSAGGRGKVKDVVTETLLPGIQDNDFWVENNWSPDRPAITKAPVPKYGGGGGGGCP